VELQFFITPAGVRLPGVPMPMLKTPRAAARARCTSAAMAASVPA
jgi:hypothetical protein